MLISLSFDRFRCFDAHSLDLRPLSILVGANNAGKSTIVEALRLIALVANRYRSLTYHEPPAWTELARQCRGVSPSTQGLELRGGSAIYRYGEPPGIVTARFHNGATVEIMVNVDESIFATIRDPSGHLVRTKGDARRCTLPSIAILPQIGPLLEREVILTPDYVRQSLDTTLASRHLRNQLNLFFSDHFEVFCALAQDTWDHLRIEELQGHGDLPTRELSLLIRDSDFVAEVGWMGHGLQMWLQIMWFLARAASADTIILDEPDVYMHADLQRKLIRLLRGRHPQTILATHSVEIMSEVPPENIVVIDRHRRASRFATSLPGLQRFLDGLGSAQNIQIARLWNSRRCIMIEGKDLDLLRIVKDTLYPKSALSLDVVPRFRTGGWGGWQYALGSALMLKNAADESIIPYCIFDRDYHTPEEIQQRYAEAEEKAVSLHIWARKEIENYLLVPSAIARLIQEVSGRDVLTPTAGEIETQMDVEAEELRSEVEAAVGQELLARDRGGGYPTASRATKKILKEAYATHEGRMAIVSGKAMVSRMSAWSKERWGVSFGASKIAGTLLSTEIPNEMKRVVRAIENGRRFDHSKVPDGRSNTA